MRNVFLVLGYLLPVLFCACSGGEKSKDLDTVNVKVEGTEVYGDAAQYFAVVPGDYSVNVKEGKIRLKLKLKVLQSIGKEEDIDDYPMLDFLDEDGAKVNLSAYASLSNEEKFLSFLRMPVGEESELLFVNNYMNHTELEQVMAQVFAISIDGLSLKHPLEQIEEPLEDLLEDAAKQAEDIKVDDADIEKAVKASKSALEVGKTALDMMEQLNELSK